MRARAALAALLATAAPAALGAQAIKGVVLAEGGSVPIEGAVVEIVAERKSVTTDARGAFVIGGLRPWRYTIRARRLGYDPAEHEVDVRAGDTARVLVRLRATAATLAPVTVTESNPEAYNPRMLGFNERRQMGGGRFLAHEDLRKLDHTTLSEVVRLLGMSVKETSCREVRPCGRPYAVGRRGPSSLRTTVCPVQVFVDGVPVFNKPVPFDLTSVRIQELSGVEHYAGSAQTPLIFEKGDAMCGVLVLWTRTTQP